MEVGAYELIRGCMVGAIAIVGSIWILANSMEHDLNPLWIMGVFLGLLGNMGLVIWSAESVIGYIVTLWFYAIVGYFFMGHVRPYKR